MRFKSIRAIVTLSWPILVAQLAVLANGVADTVMTGHYNAAHLAGIGIGAGMYATVFFTLLGVLQGLSPLMARYYGAGNNPAIGKLVRQGVWVALGLSVIGVVLLSFPRPILEMAQVPTEVLPVAEGYLRVISWGLPGLMLARVFYIFSPSVHKPRAVMLINLCTLFIKIPVSYVLLRGRFGLPELGGIGCAVGSMVMFWSMFLLSFGLLFIEPYYRQFTIWHGSWKPEWRILKEILHLGLPIAVSQLVEITSFTFIALFKLPNVTVPVRVAGSPPTSGASAGGV